MLLLYFTNYKGELRMIIDDIMFIGLWLVIIPVLFVAMLYAWSE